MCIRDRTPGIPDEEFERTESVPITKEEIRAIQISKGRLSAGQTVLDIGCGSGSVTVEAAIQVEESGKVIGVDIDPNAIELTKKNLEKFGISNYTLVEGNAKEKISELPQADTIFIGGTGGDTKDIVDMEEKRWTSIGFMIMLFIANAIVAKSWKIRIANRKKYVTTGIGSFVFMYLFTWIFTYTVVNAGTSQSMIPGI